MRLLRVIANQAHDYAILTSALSRAGLVALQ